MTPTLPTQEQVDEVVRELAPDVVRVKLDHEENWFGDPVTRVYVILSDDAVRPERMGDVLRTVSDTLWDRLHLYEPGIHPHLRFRSQSEQEQLREARWE